jgi:hypothetical protein
VTIRGVRLQPTVIIRGIRLQPDRDHPWYPASAGP